jgi:hypothetical protein
MLISTNFIRFVLIAMLILPALVNAGWVDKNGNHLMDTPNMKSRGAFGALMLLTAKEKETFEKWDIPSAEVFIDTADTFKKNEFVTVLIFFVGCGVNQIGQCNLAVKFKVIQPDGGIYADLPQQEAWTGESPSDNTVQMGTSYIKIRIEDNEPLGKYEVLVDVFNLYLDTKLSLSTIFEVVE